MLMLNLIDNLLVSSKVSLMRYSLKFIFKLYYSFFLFDNINM